MQPNRVLLGAAGLALATTAAAPDAHALLLWGDSAGSNAIEVHQFSPNTGNGRGMVVVGNTAYYTVAGSGNLYELNATTGAPIGSISTGQRSLATIAYDGKNFWLGDYSGTNHAYHFDLASGMVDKTISLPNCTDFCDGLEYSCVAATAS